jgi:Zn-dependent protease
VHIDPIGTVLFPLVAIATGVPLIGWAKPVPVDPRNLAAPRRDFALVAAAGPASNLLLAAVGATVFTVLRGGDLGTVAYTMAFFVMMNVLLAVFNLIPVPPLDGGNILLGILPPSLGSVVERLRPYGILVLYGLMFSGLLSRIIYPVQNTILDWLL